MKQIAIKEMAQCRQLYEASGNGYVELGEGQPEHENTDRTHPDSGVPHVDWEAFHRELFVRAVGSMSINNAWEPDRLAIRAKSIADAAIEIYRNNNHDKREKNE